MAREHRGHVSQKHRPLIVVILAAGRAQRMGRQKLLLPIDGLPMIVRVIGAAAAWPTVVVTSHEVATILRDAPVRIIENAAPERGMSHSLALADAAIAPDEPIAVLLGDLPDMRPERLAEVIAAYSEETDIVFARAGEHPAHPVVFSPNARKKIAGLPDGDSLRLLRDDQSLRRRVIDVAADAAALTDIDTPAEYEARTKSS